VPDKQEIARWDGGHEDLRLNLYPMGEYNMETEVGKTPLGQSEAETTRMRLEEQTKKQAQSLKQDAVDRGRVYLEQRKGTAAEIIKDVADALDTAAGELENKKRKTSSYYFRTASREMRRWSASLREQGVEKLARQVQHFVGQHPGYFIGGAVVAGFTLTRAFKISERENRPISDEPVSRPHRTDYQSAPIEEVVHHS